MSGPLAAAVMDAAGTGCTVAGVAAVLRRRQEQADFLFGAANAAWLPGDISGVNGRWMLPLNAVLAVFFLTTWWRGRRRRGRVPRSYGAKSRALLAAVVRVLRERAKPGPVFRPQPGARCAQLRQAAP